MKIDFAGKAKPAPKSSFKKRETPTTPDNEFWLEGNTKGGKRKFKVVRCAPRLGSSVSSFKLLELVDGKLTPAGFSLSCPSFDDACRIEAAQNRPVSTHTYEFKENIVTVSKKKVATKSTVVKKSSSAPATSAGKAGKQNVTPGAKAGKVAPSKVATPEPKEPQNVIVVKAKDGKWLVGPKANEKQMEAEPKGKYKTAADATEAGRMKNEGAAATKPPITTIVVKAKDGRWLYGPEADAKQMEAQAKGQYATAADAAEAAAKVSDVIINTGAPDKKAVQTKVWGVSTATSASAPRAAAKSTITDGVALKKVCADAGVDPKLARRILRARGKKPGGRWEWSKEEAPKIIELLKAEAKKAKGEK